MRDGLWNVWNGCVRGRVHARGVHGAALCSGVERAVRQALHGGVLAGANGDALIGRACRE